MSHDVGETCSNHKTAEVNHAGFLTHGAQHFIGETLGETYFRENYTDHQ